jgi:hypothetical protein
LDEESATHKEGLAMLLSYTPISTTPAPKDRSVMKHTNRKLLLLFLNNQEISTPYAYAHQFTAEQTATMGSEPQKIYSGLPKRTKSRTRLERVRE